MTGPKHASAHRRLGMEDIVPRAATASFVIGAMAGEERRRRYGERIAGGRTWLAYDSLELLPHLLAGVAVEAVVVDLLRWVPVEAAPVLRELRRSWPSLRVIGVYEPSAEGLLELAELARADHRLAFACDADERFELLAGPATGPEAESPKASKILLEQLVPLAGDGLRCPIIHLALAPSRRRSIPALAALQGWSEDALERRFGDAGLVAPAAVRRLAVAADGVWHVAALRRPAEDVARALGLGTGDSLGRVIKGVFGFGFKTARLMGADGARRALTWVGLLALRDLAPFGGLPSLASIRFVVADAAQVAQDRGAFVVAGQTRGASSRLEGAGKEVWELVAAGARLGVMVDHLSDPANGPPQRFAREAVPTIRWLLRHRLIVPIVPSAHLSHSKAL